MLLICPVRPGEVNDELRYALRSWETHLHLPRYGNPTDEDTDDGLHLMTVGYKPEWLNPDTHIEGNRHKSMPHAVFDNIRLASEEAAKDRWPNALYMNDDFFCLDPVGAVLPVKRNLSLAEQIAKYPGSSDLWWPRSLRLTASWLEEAGFPHPDSFEVHRPLPASPSDMFEVLSRWDLASSDSVPQWRTAYGVLKQIEAYPVLDAKLGPKSPGVGTPWVSTSDASWRRYAIPIKRRFQKPSRWEPN